MSLRVFVVRMTFVLCVVQATMSYQFLTTRRDGAVEYLTLNRPEVRNAFNEGMIAELTDWAGARA